VGVNADASIVSTTTSTSPAWSASRKSRTYPNGRSFDLLLTLNPGVVNFTWMKTGERHLNSTTGNNFRRERPTPQQNLFLLNGVNTPAPPKIICSPAALGHAPGR